MFIQGDVLAVIALLIGVCLSAWSLTLAYGLLFPDRTELARQEIQNRPGRSIGRGTLIFFTLGLLGFIALKIPNPVVRIAGWILILSLFSLAALGVAGTALIAGERLKRMAPDLSHYGAFSRGAAFLIIGCMLPLIGWFAFGPVLWLAALGAGAKAAMSRQPVAAPVPEQS